MTALELHIGLQQQLNNVNAYLFDNYLEQEMDFYLNLAQEEYIKLHYSPEGNKYKRGFEQSQKRIDDLRELVVKYYADTAYTTEESNLYRFTFPSDYMFLVNQRSRLYYHLCDGDITTTTVNHVVSESIAYLPFQPENYLLAGESMNGFQMTVDAVSIIWGTTPTDARYYFPPHDNASFVQKVLDANLEYTDTYRVYWENYKGLYRKNNFIVVYIGFGSPGATVGWTTNDVADLQSGIFTTTNTYYYKVGAGGGGYETVLNKYVQADDIYALMIDPHNTTQPTRPLTVIHANNIDVFATNKFIVNQVIISYIRKPKRISLALNQSSELADHTHSEIIALAVNTILENTKSDRTQTNQQELLKSE